MNPEVVEKLKELNALVNVPLNSGEQFINVWINACDLSCNYIMIDYGFNWKSDLGEVSCSSLDHAIQIVKELRKRANLVDDTITEKG